MSQVDEGLIHAWLDGQLPAEEAARVERLVASDREWGAAAGEARGLIAAASRVTSALDGGISSASAVSRAASQTAAKRAVRRRPWIAIAASTVLVAGISSYAWWSMGGVKIEPALERSVVTDAAPTSVPISAPPPQASAEAKAATGGGAAAGVRPQVQPEARNEAVRKAEGAPAKRGFGTGMGRGIPANDTTIRVAVTPPGEARATVANPVSPPVVEQSVGGRALERQGAANLAAKALDESSLLDARLSGCWAQIVSADERRDRDAAEVSNPASYVLRFIAPVLTDAAQRLAPQSRSDVRMAQVLGAALPIPVQQATTRKLNDSTFNTEWIREGVRTLMTFSVRGDTLRGTTTVPTAGPDSLARPFIAARRPCPPQ